jgi:CRP/FNR family cyclic AMP-dependent transcriptional regulator
MVSIERSGEEPFLAGLGAPFETGEVIYREGDPATSAYFLVAGSVRLVKRVRGGERSLTVHREGELFGEAVLVGSTERSSTAIALSAGRALALDDDALLRLTAARPELAVRLLKQLVVRAREAEERIESMLIADTQSRVVDALLRLVSQGRREGSKAGSVTLGISPMELSARLGLDVDAVKRVVSDLRSGQYLRVSDQRLEIPDVDALRKLYALLSVKAELEGEPLR